MTPIDDQEFVDRALSDLDQVEVSARLARRIAAIAIDHPRQEAWTWRRMWQPALVLSFSAVMGVVSGTWSTGSTQGNKGEPIQTASTQQSSIDEVWLDAWELAWGSDSSTTDGEWDIEPAPREGAAVGQETTPTEAAAPSEGGER